MFKNVEDESVCSKVLNEIGKTKQEIEEQVNYLRQWLLMQPHLPHLAGDVLLRSYVLGTSSVEQAKLKLDKLYSYRGKFQFLIDRDPCLLDWEALTKAVHLPGTTPEGYKVYFIQIPDAVKKFDMENTCKFFSMDFDAFINQNEVISGHVILFDMKNIHPKLLLKLSPIMAGQILYLYQSVLPLKVKGVISINCSLLADRFLHLCVLPFLSDKIKSRMCTCTGGPEEVSKYVPLHMFPRDYGGSAPDFEDLFQRRREEFNNMRNWFLTEGSSKSDESKRPLPSTDEYGVQGTFRKINID